MNNKDTKLNIITLALIGWTILSGATGYEIGRIVERTSGKPKDLRTYQQKRIDEIKNCQNNNLNAYQVENNHWYCKPYEQQRHKTE